MAALTNLYSTVVWSPAQTRSFHDIKSSPAKKKKLITAMKLQAS